MISLQTAACQHAERCRDSNSPPDWRQMCSTCPCQLGKRQEPEAGLGADWAQQRSAEGPIHEG